MRVDKDNKHDLPFNIIKGSEQEKLFNIVEMTRESIESNDELGEDIRLFNDSWNEGKSDLNQLFLGSKIIKKLNKKIKEDRKVFNEISEYSMLAVARLERKEEISE